MSNIAIEYLTDAAGNPKAVVIPIELWRKLLPQSANSLKDLPENLEDYCLSKAMDEAIDSPVLSREDAIAFLE
ncbi:MAG: hypothetical protein F6K16_30180, partial [Symploca sp. SIO2B6]|nr:hypothetical protein [Symploca sp. SIO2B6]